MPTSSGYVHLGTGNYHPRTARILQPISVSSPANPAERRSGDRFQYANRSPVIWIEKIDGRAIRYAQSVHQTNRAGARQRAGRQVGAHRAKLNALVDQEIIEKLYEASCAEVIN